MTRHARWTGPLAGVCMLLAGCAQNPQPRKVVDAAVSRVYPSLVRIEVVRTAPHAGRILKQRAAGSGAIISPDGYVITNHHVAGDSTRIWCRLSTREQVEAELVGSDPMTDIAVLKLDLSTRPSRASLDPKEVAAFGDSDTVAVGNVVLAMGSPAGLSQSVTQGVVANPEMISPYGGFSMDGEPIGLLVRWIGHDAQIYSGNSGGPLVNLRGEIVGINEVGIGGLGGAIPSNLAESVAEQLIAGGEVKRSWTGLQVQTLLHDSPVERGVLVSGVVEDSPADAAGLQAGDIIARFDGVEVHARYEEELPLFHRLALSTPIDEKVKIAAVRDGQARTFTVTTEAREPARSEDVEADSWGMTARDLTMLDAIVLRRANKQGVLLQTLRPGGPAQDAKPPLGPGDIITSLEGRDVRNMQDLLDRSAEILEGKTDRVPVLVGFDRGTRKLLTVVEIGEEPEPPVTPTAKKAWLAVDSQVLTRELAKALDMEGKKGIRVTLVYPGKGPDQAGVQVGDIILRLDGEIIDASQPEDTQVLPNMVRSYFIGDEVELLIVRDGQEKTIAVTLDEPPTPPAELDDYTNDELEFSARNMSFEDKVEKQLEESAQGVLIQDVQARGWAAIAGLRAGDVLLKVDRTQVDGIETLESVLEAAREANQRRIVFFVRRGAFSKFLEIEPDWSRQD